MTDATLIGERYLAQLEKALIGVSAEVRDEILGGVSEQLGGLDDDAAAHVIAELGDPEFIAQEARGASDDGAPGRQKVTDTTWFAVVAAVLVMLGGIVIPFVGWVVGVVLVWLSSRWTVGERWVATLLPLAGAALIAILLMVSRSMLPANGMTPNPLIPAVYDGVWTGLVLAPLCAVVAGIWLLILAIRRA